MIPRYSRKEMTDIWSNQNKYRIFLKVESLVSEASSELDIVPLHVAQIIKEFGDYDENRIDEIEKDVKHDVIAFLTSVSEKIKEKAEADKYKKFSESEIEDAFRYMHYGMTSSDLLDTTFSYQLRQSADLIKKDLNVVLEKLKYLANQYKYQVCIGRSHGVHAEPISFGCKILGFYNQFYRNLKRLERANDEINVCMISGPVGNFAVLSPRVEALVASKLDMRPEICSTQVIARDRYAYFFSVLGVIASSIEHFAMEIRHLQRTEVLEVEEGFTSGQKGSSAMPHKKNPILSENLTGLARLIRSYVIPSMENVALLHERDISHSSVERVIAPDACILMDFALNRLVSLIENLVVHEKNMEKNMHLLGDNYKSHIALLSLIRAGLTRDEAYRIIQRNSMNVWNKTSISLIDSMRNDKDLVKIIASYGISIKDFFNEIESFDYLKYVDEIFNSNDSLNK
jgi:adenylosuccinate lyase